MTTHILSFLDTSFDSVSVAAHQPLADVLTVQNSPVLFGCRTGICGTCLVHVTGTVSPPNEDEQELLEILAPDCPNARLACQLDVASDLAIAPLIP
ncbi:MAG: 2Fe-2S iron-sulfur cluster-binding protein [Leptolyngbyaceae bacterium]|nr:2Fe-2S iron-sulfur cluster-binding protein [Leptolyngbyaceae bacterium]